MTLARVLKYPGGQLALHMAGGMTEKTERPLREMGCPRYPMGNIRLAVPMEDFLKHVGANHYALIYNHVGEEAALFCKYTGMTLA